MPEKVVYILGAGFSAPLDIPVMSNFLEKSKDMFAKNPELYSYFDDVFSTIDKFSKVQTYYKADFHNIEEILSILEMKTNLNNPELGIRFEEYIVDVIKYHTPDIVDIPKAWGDDLSAIFGGKNPYRDYGVFISCLLNIEFRFYDTGTTPDTVLKSDVQTTYSVVTLNYDLVFENFSKLIKKHTHTDSIKKNFLGFSSDDTDNFLLAYAKLHGSIDSRGIILPTWNKGIRSDQIKSIWSLAHKAISEANYIRIIGYSLPINDTYVKYLLKSAVVGSKNLKKIDVICLDDYENAVSKRYEDFISRKLLRLNPSDALNYLRKVLAENSKLTDDQKGKRVTLDKLEEVHEQFMNE